MEKGINSSNISTEKTAIFVSFFEPFSIDKQIEICTDFSKKFDSNIKIISDFQGILNEKFDNIVILSYLSLGETPLIIYEKLEILKNKMPNSILFSVLEETCHLSGDVSISKVYNDNLHNFIMDINIGCAIKFQKDFIKWNNYLK